MMSPGLSLRIVRARPVALAKMRRHVARGAILQYRKAS